MPDHMQINFFSRLAQWPSNVVFAHYSIEMCEIAYRTYSTIICYQSTNHMIGVTCAFEIFFVLLFSFLFTVSSVSFFNQLVGFY